MSATERDREVAGQIVERYVESDGHVHSRVGVAIAEALADERDRAREPFLRLLVQLDAYKDRRDLLSERDTQSVAWLAEHVRAAAKDAEL